MGFNLIIGEFEPVIYEEERYARGGAAPNHDGRELGAPLNSEDGYGNMCSPGYLVWRDFAKDVGLEEVFYGGQSSLGKPKVPYFEGASGNQHEGLLLRHPGAAPLHVDHCAAFDDARQAYRARPVEEQLKYVNRRLDWLSWWARWAIKECKLPTFGNS